MRALLGSSTAAVLCVGMTNVGEVVLAREVLDIGGSGLAALDDRGRHRHRRRLARPRASRSPGSGAGPTRSGSAAWPSTCSPAPSLPSFWVLLPVFVIGGFGNGFALVHDRLLLSHAAPESMHGRLFALQKACTSCAFAVSFLGAGALIAFGGVQIAFLSAGIGLIGVIVAVSPRLRTAWPAPAPAPTPA